MHADRVRVVPVRCRPNLSRRVRERHYAEHEKAGQERNWVLLDVGVEYLCYAVEVQEKREKRLGSRQARAAGLVEAVVVYREDHHVRDEHGELEEGRVAYERDVN